jgi:hypothetical protein
MAFDAAFAAKIASLIAKIGAPVAVSRAGASLFKTAGVFVNIKQVVDTSLSDSLLSKINNGTAECYIAATKTVPAPGDTVSGKNRSFTVLEVNAYQPALLVIAYKLVLE